MTRSRTVPAVLLAAVLLLAAAAGCGSDGDASDTSSTRPPRTTQSGTTDPEDPEATDTTGSDGPDTTGEDGEPTSTEDPTSTTSPNLPPNDSPLAVDLVPPADLGGSYAPQDALGDGSFDTDLCEEVTMERTWEDEASQALMSQSGGTVAFSQSIMRFADAAAATAMTDAFKTALETCQPGVRVEDVAGAGDQTRLYVLDFGGGPNVGVNNIGVVRVGDRVSVVVAIAMSGSEQPVDVDFLKRVAADLAG